MDKDTEEKEFGVSPVQGAIEWLVQYENYLKALSSVFGVPRELLSLPTPRALDADTWLCKKCNRASSDFRVNCFWCGHPRQ